VKNISKEVFKKEKRGVEKLQDLFSIQMSI